MKLSSNTQLKAYKNSGWTEVGGNQYAPPNQNSTTQYDHTPEHPASYTQEQLEQIAQTENGRKDLFAIADAKGISYPLNVPTARIIDQILVSQAG